MNQQQSADSKLKTPITYYGGKQRLVSAILPLIPLHTLYVEPFAGGAAIFFAKEPSTSEILNDTNRELINFYKIASCKFAALKKEIELTLHSRGIYNDARVVYANPHLFTDVKRAWALWVLCSQGFSAKINGGWGFTANNNKVAKSVYFSKNRFIETYAKRLEQVQLECLDALTIIQKKDSPLAFFYCDPPYVGSHCGHYDSYTVEDFEMLLKCLSKIQGKFLLSSYPSAILSKWTKAHGWHTKTIKQRVSVNAKTVKKQKIEVLTANYPI